MLPRKAWLKRMSSWLSCRDLREPGLPISAFGPTWCLSRSLKDGSSKSVGLARVKQIAPRQRIQFWAAAWRLASRLDSIAHGAEARKRARPLVPRRAADDAQRVRVAEPQPLHHGHGSIVLAAGGIDPGLVAGHAVDADRLRHRDPRVAHAGDRCCRLLGKAAAVVRLRRRGPDQ